VHVLDHLAVVNTAISHFERFEVSFANLVTFGDLFLGQDVHVILHTVELVLSVISIGALLLIVLVL